MSQYYLGLVLLPRRGKSAAISTGRRKHFESTEKNVVAVAGQVTQIDALKLGRSAYRQKSIN